MRQYLFICLTQLQLISALNIIDEMLEKGEVFEADLILKADGRQGIRELEEGCTKLGVFRNIVFFEHEHSYRFRHWLRNKSTRQIGVFDVALYSLKFLRYYFYKRLYSKTPLKLFQYSSVFYFNKNKWLFKFLSPACEYHVIDEGVGSYTSRTHFDKADVIHLYEPELCCYPLFPNEQLRKQLKISPRRKRLFTWLNQLFNADTIEHIDFLYLDQPLDDKKDNRMCLLKSKIFSDFVKKYSNNNLQIRSHPAMSNDVKSTYQKIFGDVYTDRNSGLSLEMQWMLSARFPKEIHTISSSGALYWMFMFEDNELIETKVYLYWPIYRHYIQNDKKQNLICLDKFFEKIQARYPNHFFLKNQI